MIARENRAKVQFGTVGIFKKTPVIWVTLPVGRSSTSRTMLPRPAWCP